MMNTPRQTQSHQEVFATETPQWPASSAANPAQADMSKMLAIIAQQAMKSSKWVTVVGGKREQIEQLAAAGVNRTRIRWIQGKDADQREWATEQALLAGTSAVVVSWLTPLEKRSSMRFKMASRASCTQHFLFSESTLPTPLH